MQRLVYLGLGLFFVSVGILGIFLPLLPSTIFFIIAAMLFARSNPAWEKRLLNHPHIGPHIINWRENRAISPKSKVFAVAGMTIGYMVFQLTAKPDLILSAIVALILLGCALYVTTRPSGNNY